MKRKYHTNEELISELQRFVKEKGFIPNSDMMQPKYGYPSYGAYINHFGSWNNALEIAGYKLINKRHIVILDGTETCSYCGKRADEIPNFTNWYYHDDKPYCKKHGQEGRPHYVRGELDINSPTGLGRVGEILVIKTLGIGKEHDCNRISCGYSFDMYHKDYGRIDVKTSLLNKGYQKRWVFILSNKPEIKTFICVGLSSNRSAVEHIWIIPNKNNKKNFSVTNVFDSLNYNNHWEVNVKPYNDMWQTMKLKTCNSMTDKSEPKVTRTWKETLKALAELNKKYGVK